MLKNLLGTPSAFVLFALSACASSDPPAQSSSSTTPIVRRAHDDSPKQTCVTLFQHQRTCTDTYIPALVAARVRLNKPDWIAASDQKEGRDTLVAKAMEEWKIDSTDTAIDGTCDKILSSTPPDQARLMVDTSRACLAKDSCRDFVACVMPMVEAHLR